MNMDIRPILTEADNEWAINEIESIIARNPDPALHTPDGARLSVLTTLVEAYEDEHYPIEGVDPVDAILFSMEQNGRTQSDLADLLGSKPRASEILNRKRDLTKAQAHLLSTEWHIPAGMLIAPARIAA